MATKAASTKSASKTIVKDSPDSPSPSPAPKKATTKTKEAKSFEIILNKADPKKNSVVYKNDSGQSIYLMNEYIEDPRNPPAQIRMVVTAVK